MKSKRISNLEIRPTTYLLPKENWPKNPSWSIDYWYPNAYYGHESEYIRSESDPDWYYLSNSKYCRIHKDCFKNPQSCFSIASFRYDNHEGLYELSFIGDRPVQLTKEERDIFWELIKYGYDNLNKESDYDENE